MSGTEWVAPGKGESLGVLRETFGNLVPSIEDFGRRTSLALTGDYVVAIDEKRMEEIERRVAAKEEL